MVKIRIFPKTVFFKNNADLDVKGNPDRFKCLKSCNRIVAFKYKFVVFR